MMAQSTMTSTTCQMISIRSPKVVVGASAGGEGDGLPSGASGGEGDGLPSGEEDAIAACTKTWII